MRLWTWHRPEFPLIEGRVDISRSEYADNPRIMAAYKEVADRIGTDQIIWCYTVPDQRIQLPCHTHVEWVLDVPRDKILCFVDEIIWGVIRGEQVALPDERRRWRNEAIARSPDDPGAWRHYEEQQKARFFASLPPAKDCWEHLFVNEQASPTI